MIGLFAGIDIMVFNVGVRIFKREEILSRLA